MRVRRRGGLRIGAWTVVVATAVLAVVLASRFGTDPGLVESPLIGRPAPEVVLPRLVGEGEVELSALEGNVVVVNFFASWCLECRVEHPALLATAASFADAGVEFVGISHQDDPVDSLEFLDEEGVSPTTHYLDDAGSRAAIAFGVFGIPETFLIDAEGVVAGRIVGPSDALTLGSAIDAVRRGEQPGNQVVGNTRSGPGD